MIEWQIQSPLPVVAPGSVNGKLDQKHAGSAHVIEHGGHYHLFYWAISEDGEYTICRAQSHIDNPNHWLPRGSILGNQPGNVYNSTGPSFPHVVPVTDTYWLMYVGCWGNWQHNGRLPNTTAVAESNDGGETWQYVDTVVPLIPLDRPYDQSGTGSVWVMIVDGKFRMYYTSIGAYTDKPKGVRTGHGDVIPRIGIAYAESDDGIHWEKPLDDLMVSPRGFDTEPYEYISSKPCIVREGPNQWRLFVNTFGTAYRVRSLCSTDGLNWTWNPSGIDGEMGVGSPGSFDDHQRSYPVVLQHGDEYRCWYTGNGFGRNGLGYATGRLVSK